MNIYPLLKDGIEIAYERQIYTARQSAQRLATALDHEITLNGGREYGIETFEPCHAANGESCDCSKCQTQWENDLKNLRPLYDALRRIYPKDEYPTIPN